ncbi:MAG: hypothetical protein KJZ69_09320 [Phycisphaerales bacterium]|nr:hypothetical protein [Phycisphaerales bacterium]
MNLALRDVRHNLGRFGLTAVGIGLLLMIVMGMGGIYQGIVEDATLLVDELDADLWLVQAETRGPSQKFRDCHRISKTGRSRCPEWKTRAGSPRTPFNAHSAGGRCEW